VAYLRSNYLEKISQKWSQLFWVFIVVIFTPLFSIAGESQNSSSPKLDFYREPIQPLVLPANLNPQIVHLGKRLFNDKRLSAGNDLSCASCHSLEDNGAAHNIYSIGRDGLSLSVNTLTVFNSSLNHRLFWDGRAESLEDQINFVVAGDKEFNTTWPDIVNRLRSDQQYADSFDMLYGDGITADNIRNAIATFERTLVTVNSRFDRFLLGDTDAISEDEKAGYRLFKNFGCIACHQGQNVGGNLFMKFGVFEDYFAARGNATKADAGRFNVTGKESDRHVFRVPSLRLAALTAPYFHDGSTKTLEEAIGVMAAHQLGRKISKANIRLIAAFIRSLPGEYNGRALSDVTYGATEHTHP